MPFSTKTGRSGRWIESPGVGSVLCPFEKNRLCGVGPDRRYQGQESAQSELQAIQLVALDLYVFANPHIGVLRKVEGVEIVGVECAHGHAVNGLAGIPAPSLLLLDGVTDQRANCGASATAGKAIGNNCPAPVVE